MSWPWWLNPFTGVNRKLDDLKRRLIKMSTDQAQFDNDLKVLTDAIVALIAAVDKLLETKTDTDFTAEDTAVKDAAAAVAAELEKINPPA